MRTTYVAPLTAETARELQRKPAPLPLAELPSPRPTRTDVLLVGLDLGTSTSCLKAAYPGSTELVANEILPTAVGYAREGIVENLLPGNARVLYGHLALKHRVYLRLLTPLQNGVIEDLAAAQDFARHLRQILNPPSSVEVRAVVGVPASADRTARENLCAALGGVFHKVLLIPEPFLAALGYRDESRLGDPAYLDPVRNSLFVDIGAGTTDVCLVQGYYPGPHEQVSSAFAGDEVDSLLLDATRRLQPDANLSGPRVREIKEQHSFAGLPEAPAVITLVVGGKARKLDFTDAISQACQRLLQEIFELVKVAIGRASSDTVEELMQNIVLTGGGSRIRHLDTELQRLLVEDGYEQPRVQTVGEGYKELVARGALTAARQAKESQWQALAG
jgi:rod shape-determining protein MreB